MTDREIDYRRELLEQLTFAWENQFRPRLAGLTDEEYFWEPVPGCWSVRPAGDGRFSCDWAFPAPSPPPFTTIAWRLAHIGSVVLDLRASNHFGDGSFDIATVDWPGSAADGIAFVEDGYRKWTEGLKGMAEADLARECGPAEGPYQHHPFATLVLHISREVIHHAAEVALLRDLYLHSGGRKFA